MAYAENENLEQDITRDVLHVLKTLLLLDRNYGVTYLVQILRGDEKYPLRKEEHREIETFAMLEDSSYGFVNCLVFWMIDAGYIQIEKADFGTLELSEKGKTFLSNPEPIIVMEDDLRVKWYELELSRSLKELRRKIATELGKPVYEVLGTYTLQQISRKLPVTEEELSKISGMEKTKNSTRRQILNVVKEIAVKKAEDDQSGIYTRAYSYSHRKIREMFESGIQIEEMARRRKVKTSTVITCLDTLHTVGMINMKPWIEQHVDPKVLNKGSEYFRQVKSGLLREAREVLGFDYDTLQFCRMYSSGVEEPAQAYAA
ncbi:MAG: hypothetical protein EAZ89_13110 [Bacteroidetes bacterium]|nr:MAG: hypothetical protein EAZ89_13110 [Bacteroidota bacterium]